MRFSRFYSTKKDRFLNSIKLINKLGTEPNRKANNSAAAARAASKGEFVNQPDSDPAIVSVRENAKKIQKQSEALMRQIAKTKNAGLPLIDSRIEIDKLIKKSLTASSAWGREHKKRQQLLFKAANEIENSRHEVIWRCVFF